MPVASVSSPLDELRLRPIGTFVSSLVVPPLNSNLSTLIAFLRDRGVHEVFLPESNRCGIISLRDVLKLGNVQAKPSSLMLRAPILSEQATVGQAARLMANRGINAIPVSDGRRIVGQVNRLDLLKEIRGKIGDETRITSIATGSPVTVDASTSVATIKDLMIRKRIEHIPVVSEGHLNGIITSAQIVSLMTPPERIGSKSRKPETRRSLSLPAGDVMETDLLTCPPETSLDAALELMLAYSKTCVLITRWEELQAIATHRDVTSLLAEAEPEPEVPIYMIGLPEDPFEAEAAKAKFSRTVSQLHRIFPDILEAESVIRSKFSRPDKERGRHEVTVHIRTAKKSYNYSAAGWELADVYDLISNRLKRLMTQKRQLTREREEPEIS